MQLTAKSQLLLQVCLSQAAPWTMDRHADLVMGDASASASPAVRCSPGHSPALEVESAKRQVVPVTATSTPPTTCILCDKQAVCLVLEECSHRVCGPCIESSQAAGTRGCPQCAWEREHAVGAAPAAVSPLLDQQGNLC